MGGPRRKQESEMAEKQPLPKEALTMRTLLVLTAVLVSGGTASAADKIWSVPAVISNGLATVFSCTNGVAVPATVTVDIFLKNGIPAPGGTATININPGVTG